MFRSSGREELGAGRLSSVADAYVEYLRHRGHRDATVRMYVHCAEHFAHWLAENRLPVARIDESLVHRFVGEHLPSCNCPDPCQRTAHAVHTAIVHLLRVLRSEGWIPNAPIQTVPAVHEEVERYDAYLREVCGLASATRISRRMWVKKFLLDRFKRRAIAVTKLKPGDIVNFVAGRTSDYAPGTAGVIGCALRSYLRFRAVDSGEHVESLVAAVPTVAHWRLEGLPSRLTSKEVRAFLSAFDRRTASGLRGYAIARCLTDLGLRAHEVAQIELGDLNWRQGVLTIRAGKSRRSDVLPLPESTGRAIVEYLRRGRPVCTSRALFVRHRSPLNAPISPSIVRCTVRLAFSRAGLAARYSGTHVLRRTAATRMLYAGASLKEIADVLRHRSLDTTQAYTKVDLPRLASLAAPWPGRPV